MAMRLVFLGGLFAAAMGESTSANPIRRVVSLLQQMQEKVTAEGKREEELFSKFMCYCKTGTTDLANSISASETRIQQSSSNLDGANANKAQLEQDLEGHKADREDAKDALAKATALREKEAGIYAKDSSDDKTNIAALNKAIAALEKGVAGGFLQTTAAAKLRQLSVDMDMSAADRDMLSAFLSESNGYVPQSGQIIGILKQMLDTMEKDLASITATENQAIADYEALSAAKTKEIEANGAAIEDKTARHGQVGLEIVELQEDIDDTTKSLGDDQKFLADLKANCATKEKEWQERSATRAEELVALADTIKLLNDDDALELFKKALPAPTLLQTQVAAKEVRQRALSALGAARRGGHGDPRMDLVMLALSGRSGKGFEKVTAMIDEMVALLGKEQTDDDEKKTYCEASLDKAEDEKKVIDQTAADLEKAMEDAKEQIATLTEEIKALEDGIKALDKSVAEATEQRQAENAEFKQTMAEDKAAKELIGVAKNRLNKFYNPKMYRAPPKRELSAEERIFVNNGGEESATPAPGGIANTGITYLQSAPALVQVAAHRATNDVAPPPTPETWGAYANKGQESNGVIAMLDMLVADLDKEMQQMEVEESEAQKEYEAFMEDSKNKRTADAKSIADKEGYKADLEVALEKDSQEHHATLVAGMDKAEQIKDLHLECDWLTSNYEARKEARSGEIESLKNAKAVLSGADYALVQRRVSVTRRLRGGA